MLSGRLRAAFFNRTGRFVAAISLEEKFCPFAAAQAAHRISIPSQSFLPPVSNTDGKVYRLRIHSLDLESLILEFEILNLQFRFEALHPLGQHHCQFVDFQCRFSKRFCQSTIGNRKSAMLKLYAASGAGNRYAESASCHESPSRECRRY